LLGRRPTLPRHLHRAVLRLLRPAEAAVRRLVIVAARGVAVPPPQQRPRKPKPKKTILRKGIGTGIVIMRNFPLQAGFRQPAARTLCLPLTDALPRWRSPGRPAASGVPRISFPGFGAPPPVAVRRPPLPSDPIDATRLALRLEALGRALDDLPGNARRFARWRNRVAVGAQNKESRERGLVRRISPLRPGRPPGQRQPSSRRPAHEVHEVLGDLHYFAFKALERPDTS
jgi:hypothetical protein